MLSLLFTRASSLFWQETLPFSMLARGLLNLARGFKGRMSSRSFASHNSKSLPEPSKWHTRIGLTLEVIMWLWIFHRFEHDGRALFGLEYHFDHHHHHPSPPPPVPSFKMNLGRLPTLTNQREVDAYLNPSDHHDDDDDHDDHHH